MQHSSVRRAVDSHGRRERKRIGTTSSSVYRLSRQLAHAQGGDRDWRAGAFLAPERGGLPESIWASYAAICVCEDELLLKRPLHHLPPIAPYHRTPSKPVHSSPSSPHTHHHQLPTPHLLLAATKPSTSLSLTFSAANQPPAPFTVAHPQPTTFVFLPATLRDPFDQHQRHPHPLSFVASRPISCPSPRDRYSSSSRSFCSPSLPAGRRQRASRIHDLICAGTWSRTKIWSRADRHSTRRTGTQGVPPSRGFLCPPPYAQVSAIIASAVASCNCT